MIISYLPSDLSYDPIWAPLFTYTGRYTLEREKEGWMINFLSSGVFELQSGDTEVD